MGLQSCVHCGKETGEGELYCPECQAIPGAKRSRRVWLFSILFSAVLLSLTGLLLWHGGISFGGLSLDSILGRPAAVINGEPITRADLQAKVKNIGAMLERQYGRNLFAGQQGRVLLANLEQEVLDGMLEERLVSQEARRLNIQISEAMVQEELQKKEIYGDWEKFQARLREEGVSKEDLQNHVRNILIYKAVKAAKAPPGSDPEVSFNAWLIQAKQKAELVIYETKNSGSSASLLGGSCCAPGGQSGESTAPSRAGGQLDPETESQAKKAAIETYQGINPADKEVTAKVTNYGCHIQVDIQKEGKIVKSYSYQGGKAFEIS